MLEFSTKKEYKARKKHVCDQCGGIIQPGETYTRYSGKYEGEMFDLKYHNLCHKLIDSFLYDTGECEYSEDEVTDWICETLCRDCKHGSQQDDDCSTSVYQCEEIIRRFTKEEHHA